MPRQQLILEQVFLQPAKEVAPAYKKDFNLDIVKEKRRVEKFQKERVAELRRRGIYVQPEEKGAYAL